VLALWTVKSGDAARPPTMRSLRIVYIKLTGLLATLDAMGFGTGRGPGEVNIETRDVRFVAGV
jgi:hypothetical protein